MIKLFIIEKTSRAAKKNGRPKTTAGRKTVRRKKSFSDSQVTGTQLALMNEQNIFPIRELSLKGMSVHCSSEVMDRYVVGDCFDSKVQFNGELYDLNVRVAWKDGEAVGFEAKKLNSDTKAFFKRLLGPADLAHSFEVSDSFEDTSDHGMVKTELEGEDGSYLCLWHRNGDLTGWYLKWNDVFVEWGDDQDFRTGKYKARGNLTEAYDFDKNFVYDSEPSSSLVSFAKDVIGMIPLAR